MFKDTELYRHASRELDMLLEDERKRNSSKSIEDLEADCEKFGGKTPQEFINDEVLKIISVIDPSIHSTKSILHVLDLVYRLVQLENLLPLTLDDREFVKVLDEEDGDSLYQSIRNIKVFKSSKRGIYHLDGKTALNMAIGKFEDDTVKEPVKAEGQLSIFDYDSNGNVKE